MDRHSEAGQSAQKMDLPFTSCAGVVTGEGKLSLTVEFMNASTLTDIYPIEMRELALGWPCHWQ